MAIAAFIWGADACLTARHDREEEARDEDAALVQLGRHGLGQRRLAQHDRDDGGFAGQQVETGLGQPVAPVLGLAEQIGAQIVGALDQVNRGEASGGDRRRQRVREQIAARAGAAGL